MNMNMNNSVKNNVFGFVKCFWHLRFTPEIILYNIIDSDEYQEEPEYIDVDEITDWQTYYK